MPAAGIILTTLQWFEECLRRECKVFYFSPNSRPNVRGLQSGSTCFVLAKPHFKAPRGEWAFVGELTVKDVRLVRGEEFGDYASKAVEVGAPFPRPGEASWVIEFEEVVRYDRPVKLAECNDIRTSTSRKPMSEWVILGFTYIRPEDAPSVVEAIRRKARGEGPSHDELVEKLLELGSWLNFVARREEPTPDGSYRMDVTWRDAKARAPLKAFEIERSESVDAALTKLVHARHAWNCDQLWLIVSDEERTDRARVLVGPRVRGTPASIRNRLRVLSWKELHDLHSALKPHEELLKDLTKR
uniref:EVE domain-containing protein n=1 Tax=Fervidicoccus fontis TaxID=683846 RepID=A0A7J3ZIH2_9CREN